MADTSPPGASLGGDYRIVGGRLHNPEGCELNVVLHCNLRCRACSHLSPVLPPWFADPAQIARDLVGLAGSYSCGHVKILGGEPLLHPRLPEVIAAVRDSGITDRVAVCTNGRLLSSRDPWLWRLVDEIEISVYPGQAPTPVELDALRRRAEEHAVRLDVKLVPVFRESYAEQGSEDPHLTARIYRTCEIVHVWRCHTVHEGVFYRCPQSYFLHRPEAPGARVPSDGLPIRSDPGFLVDLHAYLTSSRGPAACRWCLGTVGRRRPHSQLPRAGWRAAQDAPSEELVDLRLLAEREQTQVASRYEKRVLGSGDYAPSEWLRRRPTS
ncbi:radical SAM protein [Kitasatospora sp. NPDC088264]|uniref:radical SAM protein n=1 Tax=Kitasatospora sp. NPDC088264 TaxID=3155296 RepID=UPI00344907D2